MSDVAQLKDKIARREYTVGVIGLGYVGLPLVLRFGEVGFRVIGFDVDAAKVKQLNDGTSYSTSRRRASRRSWGRGASRRRPTRAGSPSRTPSSSACPLP